MNWNDAGSSRGIGSRSGLYGSKYRLRGFTYGLNDGSAHRGSFDFCRTSPYTSRSAANRYCVRVQPAAATSAATQNHATKHRLPPNDAFAIPSPRHGYRANHAASDAPPRRMVKSLTIGIVRPVAQDLTILPVLRVT